MALRRQRTEPDQLPFERLLKNNNLGIIENPLRRIDEDDIEKDIRTFHDGTKGLAEVVNLEVLIRGGLLARDEEGFKAEGELSGPEKKALNDEKTTSIWTESKELRIILLTCFVASIVQGWAQGAVVGANQFWPNDLGLRTGLTSSTKDIGSTGDLWRFSATNAIVYFSASTLGAFLCDPLTELVTGRRGALFVAAIFTFGASIGEAYVHSWQALFATRVLLGIGMGAKTSVVPVYESEVSPARLRGTSTINNTEIGMLQICTDRFRSISGVMADRDCARYRIFRYNTSHCTAKLALPDFQLVHTLGNATMLVLCWLRVSALVDQEATLRRSLQGPLTPSWK